MVGGNWWGSPATTVWLARASATTALSGVTWEASSKITTSKHFSIGSTWDTTSGLMAQQGLSAVSTWGACWKRSRTGT